MLPMNQASVKPECKRSIPLSTKQSGMSAKLYKDSLRH